MNTKLHAVTDADGRPLSFFMTAGQVSDYTGAAALLDDLPKAQWMLADRGYDADWYRDALQAKGITPCIPGRKSRAIPIKYDKRRYQSRSRSRIEIMFGRLKDWQRVATRYDRCPTVFFSAIALAAPSSPGCDQRILSLICIRPFANRVWRTGERLIPGLSRHSRRGRSMSAFRVLLVGPVGDDRSRFDLTKYHI